MKGIVKRFSLGGINYDPSGDFEVQESGIKRELAEVTRKETYLTESGREGMVSGAIHVTKETVIRDITDAVRKPFFLELANGKYYSGTVSYTGDAKLAGNESTLPIELTGQVREQ